MEKPLRNTAIAGILSYLLPILGFIVLIIAGLLIESGEEVLSNSLGILSLILMFIAPFILLSFFYYGFVILSKKYNNKLLKITSWIMIGILIITLLGFSILMFSGSVESQEDTNNVGELENLEQDEEGDPFVGLLIILGIILWFLSTAITYILMGVGLLRIDTSIAKGTGIMSIITGSLFLIPIFGWMIAIPSSLATTVLGIILLFKASSKFE